MENIKSILIGHPYWGRGGAEIATMYLIAALKDKYNVHIITRGGWDLSELNACAGTALEKSEIQVIYPPFSSVLKHTTGGAIWDGLYRRYCRIIAPKYDLCITASRVLDWGVPAVHFLTDVTWNSELQKRYNSSDFQLSNNSSLKNILFEIGKGIAGKSNRFPLLLDVFVANSKWTAKISQEYCSTLINTVSPVIPGHFIKNKGTQREYGFVVLGRISVEKRIEDVIDILKKVRDKGFKITLKVIGNFDSSHYSNFILSKCNEESRWITCTGSIYGNEKAHILSTSKFGISGCSIEAFGIATAEMIKSGIIPFVPLGGAQKEIVSRSELIYSDIQEGVDKIIVVLQSESLQIELQEFLLNRSKIFSINIFNKSVIEIVGNELSLHQTKIKRK
jgi:glycosyltransferase involved in cell wall biosynthesis